MKPQIISFKSISSQGLKAKTYVGVFGGAVRIIQRGFIKGNPHSSCEVLRKVGEYYFIQTEIAFKPESWLFINQIVDFILK